MRDNPNYDLYKRNDAWFFVPTFLATLTSFVSLHFVSYYNKKVVVVHGSIKKPSIISFLSSLTSYVPKHFFCCKNYEIVTDDASCNNILFKKVAGVILNFKKISIISFLTVPASVIGRFASRSKDHQKYIHFAGLFWNLMKLYAFSILATLSIVGHFMCCDNKLYIISLLATLTYVGHLAVRSKPNVGCLICNFENLKIVTTVAAVVFVVLYYRLLVFSIIMLITRIVIGCFDAVLKQPFFCMTESRFRQRRMASSTVPRDHLFDAVVKLRGLTFDLICLVYFVLLAYFLFDSLQLIFFVNFFFCLIALHFLILISFVIFLIYFAFKMLIDINFRSAFRKQITFIADTTVKYCILTESLFNLPFNWIKSSICNTNVSENHKTLGYFGSKFARRSVKMAKPKISVSLLLLSLCLFSSKYVSLNLKLFLFCVYFILSLVGLIGPAVTNENSSPFPVVTVRKHVIMLATFITVLSSPVMTFTPETTGMLSAIPEMMSAKPVVTALPTDVALTPTRLTVMPTLPMLVKRGKSRLASINVVCIFNSYLSSVINISVHLTKNIEAFKMNLFEPYFSLHPAGRNIMHYYIMFLKYLDRFYAKFKTVSPNNLNDALGKIIRSLHFRLDSLSIDKKIIKNLHHLDFVGLTSKHLTFGNKIIKSYYNMNLMTFSDGEFSQKTLSQLNSHFVIYNLDCVRSQAYCLKIKQNVFMYHLHYIYSKYTCLLVSSSLWFHRDSIGWPLSMAAHESVCPTLSIRDNICSILSVLTYGDMSMPTCDNTCTTLSKPTCDNICSTLFMATRDNICSSFSMAAGETLSVPTCKNICSILSILTLGNVCMLICDSNCTILFMPTPDNIPLSMPTHDKMAAMSNDEILSIVSSNVNSLGVVDMPLIPNIMNVFSNCKQYLHVCNKCCDYNIDHNLSLYVIDNPLHYLWWNAKNDDANDNVMNDPLKPALKCESLPM